LGVNILSHKNIKPARAGAKKNMLRPIVTIISTMLPNTYLIGKSTSGKKRLGTSIFSNKPVVERMIMELILNDRSAG
jgi:hypothetical protein